MAAAWLVLISSVVGQYPYYATPYYGYGYGYGYRTPLNYYDPIRYNRFYAGEGNYRFQPAPIANPEVINFKRPAPSTPGTTGLVMAVDEKQKRITLQLPVGTTSIAYGPNTHFLAADGNFPVIKPGNVINVNQNTITILQREQNPSPNPAPAPAPAPAAPPQ
jgi:hypothetical protein